MAGDEKLDTIDPILSEVDSNLRIAYKAQKAFFTEAKEDIQFAVGKQWSPEDKEKLAEEGRPCLTFNKIKSILGVVTGHMIQNNARIQVSPEGGEDKKFSSTFDKTVQYLAKRGQLDWQLNYLFPGGERCGRTWLEAYKDYTDDPIFGDLKFGYLGPFKIIPDPSSEAYDLSDAQFAFKIVKLSKATLKQLYPKKSDAIDQIVQDINPIVENSTLGTEGDSDNYDKDKNKASTDNDQLEGDAKKLTTIEYWYKKSVDRFFLYDQENGLMKNFGAQEELDKAIAELNVSRGMTDVMQRNPNSQIITKKLRVKQMWVCIKAGGIVLEHGVSPWEPYYSGFPFWQYIAEWVPEAENPEERVQGIVRCLKDPQREKNKARSQFLHILNTSANSGWIGDEDALTQDKWTELKNFGSTPGITIQKKKGSDLQRIAPVEPSLATQVREKAANDDFKEVSGINADLLSVDNSASPSGRAIALRIRQAITILEPSFTNFRYTKELIGNFLFKVIPSILDVARLKKILGSQFITENEINDGELRAYMTMVEDGKYDVKVAEQGFTRTMREETFDNLMSLVEKGYPIPPDVLFDFMNLPDQKEVTNKVMQYQQAQQQNALAAAQAGASAKGAI